MSSIYASIPEPTADTLLETVRALKQTVQTLVDNQTPAATTTTSASNAVTVASNPSQLGYPDRNYDDVFNDAVTRARAEMISSMTDLQTALDNFKRGIDDTNAQVKAYVNQLVTSVEDVQSQVTDEALVRTSTTQSLAGHIQTVSAKLGRAAAAVTSESIARATGDSALASRVDTVTAVYSTGSAPHVSIQSSAPSSPATGDLWIDTSTSNTLKKWSGSAWVAETSTTLGEAIAIAGAETTARATADTAISSAVTAVQAQTDAATATGSYKLTALVSPTDGAAAEFAVQVRAASSGGSGSTTFTDAGFHIQAFSSGVRRVKFLTSQFIIDDGSGPIVPFAISGGKVYIADLVATNANIDTAAIKHINIDTAAVDTGNIITNAITTPTINTNAVTIPNGYTNTSTITATGSNQIIATFSFTLDYIANVQILYFMQQGYPSSTTGTFILELYIDGTKVANTGGSLPVAEPTLSYMSTSGLSAGSHTAEILWNNSNTTVQVSQQNMMVLGVKR